MTLRYYVMGLDDVPVELTDYIWTALEWNASAEELNAATGDWVIEDPDATLDLYAWRRVWVLDDEAPDEQTVIGMGSIADVHVRRSEVYGRNGTCRAWHLTITDLNYAMHYRLFDEEDDPDRPDETDLARLGWWMGTGSALLLASGDDYQDTTSGVDLDEYDWTGQSSYDVFRGMMDQSGRNAFVLYDETKGPPEFEVPAAGELQLWYAHVGSELWSSAIMLSNDPSEILPANGVYPLAEDDLDIHLDPTRIYWKLQVAYDGGAVTVQDIDIADRYGARETTVDAADLKTAGKATARGNRMLEEGATPAVRLSWGFHCRSDHVNALQAGQSFQYRATHLGGLTEQGVPDFTQTGGVTVRAMDRTVREEGPGLYYVTGSAVPTSIATVVACDSEYEATPSGEYPPLNGTTGDGFWHYFGGGDEQVEVPTPGHDSGGFGFPDYGTGGSPDYAGDCSDSTARIIVVGAGTLTIETATYGGVPKNLELRLRHRHTGDPDPTEDDVQTGSTGTTYVFDVTTHGGTECVHWVDITDTQATCGGKFGVGTATWESAE